jgi:hypothetical protein
MGSVVGLAARPYRVHGGFSKLQAMLQSNFFAIAEGHAR